VARERIGESAVRLSYNAGARVLGFLGLKELVRRHVVPRLVGVLQSTDTPGAYAAADRYVENEIERVVRKPGPIILGPFLSEVGFELLYWIPLLRWIKDKWQVDPERLVVVSRGGTALWYEGLIGRYLDVFDFTNPDRFAARSTSRWKSEQRQKQFVLRAEDEKIIAWTRQRCGAANAEVLHPSLMYRLFAPVFQGQLPIEAMLKRAHYERFAKPDLPGELASKLPQDYAAIRFYFRPSFPDTPQNREFVRDLVGRVARTMPVVLLNTGIGVDDHVDCPANSGFNLEGLVTPANNLDVQSGVIANARTFIGTYGGLSYLAPFFGVPSIAFHSNDRDLKAAHLEAIRAACRALDGHFIELHINDVVLLNRVGLTESYVSTIQP
jgi:hypothetical protein